MPALLRHRGPVGLPVVTGKGVPLLFRRWNGGALQPGPFGTSHPAESAGLLIPEVLIVPLAAFDRAGHRIGYGGGYYDRTLQLLRKSASVMAIGLAFASQEVAEIPSEAFDQPLDLVVTDRDVFVTKR